MIQVIYENGQFLAKGTFSLGIAGVYENKEFGQEQIEIDADLDYILKELKKEDSFLYQPLFPYLKDKGEDGAAIAKGLEDYYNQKEAEIYDTEESVYDWESDFYEKPNNGTMQKTDVEGKLRKMYPMFNFDGLYQSIIPEGICLDGRFLKFQFSDGWGAQLLECAYDRFDENFTSCEWHNH